MLTRCDAPDGSADGLVQDVEARRTAFNFATDVPTGTGARDGTGDVELAANFSCQ